PRRDPIAALQSDRKWRKTKPIDPTWMQAGLDRPDWCRWAFPQGDSSDSPTVPDLRNRVLCRAQRGRESTLRGDTGARCTARSIGNVADRPGDVPFRAAPHRPDLSLSGTKPGSPRPPGCESLLTRERLVPLGPFRDDA